MIKILSIIQIVVSLLLIACILVQSRGGGLSTAFGGTGESYSTKRGLEKKIFIATIALAVIFLGLSVTLLLI